MLKRVKMMTVISIGVVFMLATVIATSYTALRAISEADSAAATAIWVLSGVLVAMIVGMMVFVRNVLISPLHRIGALSRQFSQGKSVEFTGNVYCSDLVPVIENFMSVIDQNTQNTKIAQSLMEGELNEATVQLGGDNVLGKSLLQVFEKITYMSSELENLSTNVIGGRLEKRASVGDLTGEYAEILEKTNLAVATLVGHLESVPAPIKLIDKEFNLLYVNRASAEMNKMTLQEMRGKHCYDLISTSICQNEKCAGGCAMTEGKLVTRNAEAHHEGKDYDVTYTSVPFKNKHGEIIGALEIVTDNTEILSAKQLAEKRANYQSAEVAKLSAILKAIATGDLRVSYEVAEADEDTEIIRQSFTELGDSLAEALASLNELLAQVAVSVEEVSNGSIQVSQASTRSHRTSEFG